MKNVFSDLLVKRAREKKGIPFFFFVDTDDVSASGKILRITAVPFYMFYKTHCSRAADSCDAFFGQYTRGEICLRGRKNITRVGYNIYYLGTYL